MNGGFARDEGITLVETSVAMLVTALMLTAMIGFVMAVSKADVLHDADDLVTQDLRVSRELLSRDLRSAEYLTTASEKSVSMWLDADRDDVQDVGEVVTWTIGSDGGLVRADDDGAAVNQAVDVDYAESLFTYDSAAAAEVARVRFVLVSNVVSTGGGGERVTTAEIHLRNRG